MNHLGPSGKQKHTASQTPLSDGDQNRITYVTKSLNEACCQFMQAINTPMFQEPLVSLLGTPTCSWKHFNKY